MKLKIYAVKDVVVGEMANPFYLNNDDEAKRAFKNAVNGNSGNISLNYKDMQLFKLGEYDTTTGEIVSKVEFIENGQNVKVGG